MDSDSYRRLMAALAPTIDHGGRPPSPIRKDDRVEVAGKRGVWVVQSVHPQGDEARVAQGNHAMTVPVRIIVKTREQDLYDTAVWSLARAPSLRRAIELARMLGKSLATTEVWYDLTRAIDSAEKESATD